MKKLSKGILIFLLSLPIASCSSSRGIGTGYSPIVDFESSPAAKAGRDYNSDLNSCRGLATQASPVEDGLVQGLGGAALGAAAGAAIGAITGQPGRGAAIGATGGGILGVGRGAAGGVEKQEQVIKECMRGRGWNAF